MEPLHYHTPKRRPRIDWLRRYFWLVPAVAVCHCGMFTILFLTMFDYEPRPMPQPLEAIMQGLMFPMFFIGSVSLDVRDIAAREGINALICGLVAVGMWHVISRDPTAV